MQSDRISTEASRAENPPVDRDSAYQLFKLLVDEAGIPRQTSLMQAFSSLSGIPYGVCEKAVEVDRIMQARRELFNQMHRNGNLEQAKRVYEIVNESALRGWFEWEAVRLFLIRSDYPSWVEFARGHERATGKHF